MTSYTPGPWFWSQGVDDWELVGADANRVLFSWSDRTKWKCGLVIGENIKDADARLIAAAPDLLAALVALTSPICSEDEDAEAHALARAALAKAGVA